MFCNVTYTCDRITRGVCNRAACCRSDREASKAAGVETNPWNLPSTPPAVADKRLTVRACQLTSFGLEVWDPVHDDVVQKQGLVVDLDVTREQTTEILHIPTAKQNIITNNISKTKHMITDSWGGLRSEESVTGISNDYYFCIK